MNFKVGDKVVVTTGKDKGKEGKITTILKDKGLVVVEGVNLIKKHLKPQGQNPGSIVDREAPVHASNVMHIDPKSKKATRVGHEIDKKGNKKRVAKKSKEKID
jgi:large subunit ribosomal protein L24